MPQPILELNLFETYSLRSIGFADVSNYQNIPATNPSFEVTPPGFNKVNVPFTPLNVNIFRSQDLLPGCNPKANLPDGIYTIKYSVSPNLENKIEQSFLRTTHINSRLQKAFLGLDCSCNSDNTGLLEVKLLIEGAIATANLCDSRGAIKLLNKANDKLTKLEKCNC